MKHAFNASLRSALQTHLRTASTLHGLRAPFTCSIMAKRKRSSIAGANSPIEAAPAMDRTKIRRSEVAKPPRRQSSRGGQAVAITNPNINPGIIDGVTALRASPDGHEDDSLDPALPGINDAANVATSPKAGTTTAIKAVISNGDASATKSAGSTPAASKGRRKKAGAPHVKVEDEGSNIAPAKGNAVNIAGPAGNTGVDGDPEGEDGLDEVHEDEVEFKEALSRPPPVNSDYLPLPWKGRLGYVRHLHHADHPFAN